jgi:hypothetical protein
MKFRRNKFSGKRDDLLSDPALIEKGGKCSLFSFKDNKDE